MLTRTLRPLMLTALSSLVLLASTVNVQAQNRVIDGWRSGSAHYDPFNDQLHIDRERVRVRESALDPHRNHIDYGSKRYVDRYIRDASGRLVREYGWTWTSHGEPHGKLTRERVTHYNPSRCPSRRGGVIERDRDTVIYSQPRRGGGVTERNRDTVIYSQPGSDSQPRSGGVTERKRDTVIFSQGSQNRQTPRHNNSAREIRNQIRDSLFGN